MIINEPFSQIDLDRKELFFFASALAAEVAFLTASHFSQHLFDHQTKKLKYSLSKNLKINSHIYYSVTNKFLLFMLFYTFLRNVITLFTFQQTFH